MYIIKLFIIKYNKKIIINLLLIVSSVLISLIIVELLMSIIYPNYNPANQLPYYNNEDGVHLGAKNFIGRQWDNTGDFNVSIKINKYGFRDLKDISGSTARDIFVVGDSFSFGFGVEENIRYSNILENLTGLKVYNISIPGDFDDYDNLIKYAIKNGAIIKNLIIGVCMENDLVDYSQTIKYKNVQPSMIMRVRNYLGNHSTTYNYIQVQCHLIDSVASFLKWIGLMNKNFKLMSGNLNISELSENYDFENIINESAKRLNLIAKKYENTIVLIIPSRGLWVGTNKNRERNIHYQFINKLKIYDLNIIDMLEHFEAGGNPLSYYFPNNGHWNEHGHQKVSEVLFQTSLNK